MAIRTGAGTGVIVSLVVLVVIAVFLLILSIVFYSQKADALEQQAQAQEQLLRYVSNTQRGSDAFKRLEQAAASEGQSVAGHLNQELQELLNWVGGAAVDSIPQARAELARYGVSEEDTVRSALERSTRDMNRLQDELDSLKADLARRESEHAEMEARLDRMTQEHEEAIAMISQEMQTYREAAEQYGTNVQETIATLEQAKEAHRQQFESRRAELEDQLDERGQELVMMTARVNEYEDILSDYRVDIANPAMLVDADVIEVEPANKLVYIGRGRNHRIVRGMTFEIYDDAEAIRIDPRTSEVSRGKASVMVSKVGPTTSTAKITREVAGRPVVRGDVAANAIYDPDRKFKFLIHGTFDVDGDGRPSEAEADYLRSLVLDWGGEVYEGEGIPGDLDFLVMGQQPPLPPILPADAPAHRMEINIRQRQARLEYDRLWEQASNAQIPVLNANRFFILIGHTNR